MTRVLHLSTSLSGGSSLAARRLSGAQNAFGHRSSVVARTSKDLALSDTELLMPGNPVKRILGDMVTLYSILSTKPNHRPMSTFSSPTLDLSSVRELNPEVVHIHNWFNFLSLHTIREIGEIFPLVFTMHDERLLTGGCHYKFGCKNSAIGCVSCPAVNVGQQFVHRNRMQIQSSILALPKAAIVSPSNWLAIEARNSYLKGSDIPITVIPNLLEPNFYREPKMQKHSSNEIVLTFVAADIGSGYKGLSMLLEALKGFGEANGTKRICLNIIGGGSIDIPNNMGIDVARLGSLDSSDLTKILTMTDLCVVPSLHDNSPSSIIEAQLLQIPVLATRTGGIPDLIEDGVTGYLCSPTAQGIRGGLERALADNDRERVGLRGREAALLRHDPMNIVSRYDQVYQRLLNG